MQGQENGGEYVDMSHQKSLSGRKKIDYYNKILNMKTVLYCERQTLAATSHAVDIPKTAQWERKQEGAVRVHSSSTIKPKTRPAAESSLARRTFGSSIIDTPFMTCLTLFILMRSGSMCPNPL
jgi:hypothetical protein